MDDVTWQELVGGGDNWNGEIAKRAELSTGYRTQEEVNQIQRDWLRLQALANYVFDRGLISVRKAAKLMDCNIEDITESI